MKLNLLLASLLFSSVMYSQVGIGTTTPHPTSVLDIDVSQLPANAKKGFLPPRVTETERNAIANPAEGLIVYNMTEHCLNNFNGTDWISLCKIVNPNNYVTGDIKYAYEGGDHEGWYLLNGRSVSLLSTTAQVEAADLGFTTTLPNFINKYPKASPTASTVGVTSGNSSLVLTTANMPNITLSGDTNSAGGHSHSATDGYNFQGGSPFGRWGLAGTGGIIEGGTDVHTTTTRPPHTHNIVTYNSGGSDAPVVVEPTFVALNTFIYLGN